MLRGEFDKNNKKSLKEGSDMWWQLLQELAGRDAYSIWYKDMKLSGEYDYIFARGGFDYYEPILKGFPNAYKIYYGAGKRIIPEKDLGYNLILCDTKEQVEKCKKKYPHIKSSLWIKPAAKHFKPVEQPKYWDVCYVADCHSKFQEKIKNVKWVYKTLPKDMTMLHLGKSTIKPPPNVTVKRVPRLEMPKWYSACKVGIVPYKSYDSCPRVIPEMLACGVPVYKLNNVNYYNETNAIGNASKESIWAKIFIYLRDYSTKFYNPFSVSIAYQTNSLKPAAEHLRKLICGEKTT